LNFRFWILDFRLPFKLAAQLEQAVSSSKTELLNQQSKI
jgi:hypothetical protein